MSWYSFLPSEIIDDQLELTHLQAEVELHEMERQAAESRRQAEADEAERRRQLKTEADKEMERENALASGQG